MKKYIALLAGISIVLLTGCGSGADQSTVSIDGKRQSDGHDGGIL